MGCVTHFLSQIIGAALMGLEYYYVISNQEIGSLHKVLLSLAPLISCIFSSFGLAQISQNCCSAHRKKHATYDKAKEDEEVIIRQHLFSQLVGGLLAGGDFYFAIWNDNIGSVAKLVISTIVIFFGLLISCGMSETEDAHHQENQRRWQAPV